MKERTSSKETALEEVSPKRTLLYPERSLTRDKVSCEDDLEGEEKLPLLRGPFSHNTLSLERALSEQRRAQLKQELVVSPELCSALQQIGRAHV